MNILNFNNYILERYDSEEYFTPKLSKEDKRGLVKYTGRMVDWYGSPEQMIVISVDDVHGMWGNIYNKDKFDYLVNLMREYPENIELECSYGIGGLVDFTEIKEHQEAKYKDRFGIDCEGHDEPYSIGDDELDEYLGNEDYLDENLVVSNSYDINEFFNKNKYLIAKSKKSEEQIKKEFQEIEDSEEEDLEALEEFIDLELKLKEAIEYKDGDLGRFMVQLRDGHHRVMAAKEAGEQYVCLNLSKDSLKDFKGHYTLVKP